MSREFIENDLFRPFGSTKAGGFGIGMYQSRELIEGWGGHITVTSTQGKGSTIVVSVPQPGEPAHVLPADFATRKATL